MCLKKVLRDSKAKNLELRWLREVSWVVLAISGWRKGACLGTDKPTFKAQLWLFQVQGCCPHIEFQVPLLPSLTFLISEEVLTSEMGLAKGQPLESLLKFLRIHGQLL